MHVIHSACIVTHNCITIHVECTFLQMWQFLLELRCPSSVEHDWHEIFNEIAAHLVKTLPCDVCIRLFLELEGNPTAPQLVVDIFMTEATTALEELVLKKVSNYTVCCYTNKFQ